MEQKIKLNRERFISRSQISNVQNSSHIVKEEFTNRPADDQEYEEIIDSNWYVTKVKKKTSDK